jgi:fatty acid desaturase
LVPRELKTAERVLVNVCWRYWIPLFSVMYRVNNFWNWPRLRSLFKSANDRRLIALNSLVLIVVYATIVVLVGPTALLRLIGLGVLLSLIAEDLLLLSQHTHIPQQLSHGEPVRPFPTIEQEVFTRSLVFPAWLSALLLHIDAHELHHMYPFVPGYRLGGIAYETENEIDVWTWIRRARAMPGEIFLFHNRLETGADI